MEDSPAMLRRRTILLWVTLPVILTVAALAASNYRGTKKRLVRIQASAIEAQESRRRNEVAARLMFPELDADDIGLLKDSELDTTQMVLEYAESEYQPESENFDYRKPLPEPLGDDQAYLDDEGREIKVDPSLAAPEILIEIPPDDPWRPVVSVKPPDLTEVNYYFEFDTRPTFDSNLSWSAPSLLADSGGVMNLISRRELRHYYVYQGKLRHEDGRDARLKFPFTAAAMRDIPVDEIKMADFDRLALILGHHNSPEQTIREVFEFTRRVIKFGSTDTYYRPVLDVYKSGFGGCGHANGFAGELLERNGIRYRTVSGFNPKARVLAPGGGHSAAEILLPAAGKEAAQWSYFDPYLDIYLPGVSIEDVVRQRQPAEHIYTLNPFLPGRSGQVTLPDLFKMRRYLDQRARLPMAGMFQLFGREKVYGLEWPLTPAGPEAQENYWPEAVTVYVRARYLAGAKGPVKSFYSLPHSTGISGESKGQERFSPWGAASFTIRSEKRDD